MLRVKHKTQAYLQVKHINPTVKLMIATMCQMLLVRVQVDS